MKYLDGPHVQVRCLAYSPDGSTLAAGDDRTVWLWDVRAGEVRSTGEGRSDGITGLAYRPDGGLIASGTREGSVQLRDPATGRVRVRHGVVDQRERVHPNPVNALAFVAEGRGLLSVAGGPLPRVRDSFWSGDQVQLWFLDRRSNLPVSGFDPVWGFAADSAGRRLFFGTGTRYLSTWRVGGEGFEAVAGGRERSIPGFYGGIIHHRQLAEERPKFLPRSRPKAAANPRPLAASLDGRLVAAPWNHVVEIWDADESRLRATCEVTASDLAFSPDGRTLASGSPDGAVRFWDARDGRPIGRYDWGIGPVHCLAFAPDGMTMAAGGDSGLVVFDLDEAGC